MDIENKLIEEAWRGKVPIKFILASQDVVSPTPPEPVFVLCSRYGYLSYNAQIAIEYFRSYTMDLQSEMWFESSGCPLKCQLPIGVLFDMYYGKQRADRRVDNLLSNPPAPASSSSSSSSLSSNPKERVEINDSFSWVGGPWNILIHLRRFPHDQLLRCDNDSIRQLYYHSMKQALHLLHGSTLAFSALTLEHRTDMWNGACSGDYTKFMPGFREVLPLRDAVRLLPVRLIQHGLPTIQKPISVFIPSTESVTTPPTTTATINDGASTVFVEGSKGHVAVGSCERTLGDVINILLPNFMKNDNSDGNNYVLIQGVKVPLNASIFEVWSLLCSADLFLYLVIQSTQS